jgi:hypothetical protein
LGLGRRDVADRLDPTDVPVIVDERDSSLERAVELRLGRISGRLAQDLVGLAQLANFAL